MSYHKAVSIPMEGISIELKQALKKLKSDSELAELLGLNEGVIRVDGDAIVKYLDGVHKYLLDAVSCSRSYIETGSEKRRKAAAKSAGVLESKIKLYNMVIPALSEYMSSNLNKVLEAFGIRPNIFVTLGARSVLSKLKDKIDTGSISEFRSYIARCEKPDEKLRSYTSTLEEFDRVTYTRSLNYAKNAITLINTFLS